MTDDASTSAAQGAHAPFPTDRAVARGAGSVLPFPGTAAAAIEDVGGKGYSLIRLSAAGLAVPPGVVLTSGFFDEWVASALGSAHWQALRDAPIEQRPALCAALKQHASSLPLSTAQQGDLAAARAQLAGLRASTLFAVRSSSPQEDLEGASFAGGYETRLGVRPDDLVAAIRACFASLFDERVIAYRSVRGMHLSAPRMAVVIQQQIDSAVAGVAFSINPLNNDYDQAVIDANWGQGETVVAGLVTPDHWVLDKLDGTVIAETIHDKPLSRWLQADGTLIDRPDPRRSQACLSADELTQLLDLVRRIEADFEHPVDIEWAIADGRLHVLQARPVTAFVPLPAALLTAPGQRRRLYMDIALSSGLTINAPISPMGLSVFRRLFAGLADVAFGALDLKLGADDSLVVLDGGRMYLDLSNAMWLGGPRLLARKMAIQDALLARTLESIDAAEYQSPRRPVWAGLRMLPKLPVAWWRLRRALGHVSLPFLAPLGMHRRMAAQLGAFEEELSVVDNGLSLNTFWDRHVAGRLPTLFNVSLASVGPGVLAVQAFARLAEPLTRNDENLRDKLDRGFEGNVVVSMSLQMHQLARLLQPDQLRDADELARRLGSGQLPPAFVDAWGQFTQRFGCRGPLEMDVAHPRYADAPVIALRQIAAMAVDDPDYDPAASAARQIERRRAAAATVIARAGPIRRRILQQLNRVIERYAGFRDTPKQHLLLILHALRQRIVREGEELHRCGRLDAAEHVFDLDLDQLAAAAGDSRLDLRALRSQRRGYYDRLAAQVVNFPPLIDSRGRILRPPRGPRRDGEFCGIGLSPGLVRGRARTLRSPHEGPLVKGEVLIAYTTDPGWTPIFANATAVVLEIGGALQHGAVVARELGLPCVAGIEGITTAIADGQLIEVDGSAGSVRMLSASD